MPEFRVFVADHWLAILLALFGLGALVWASGLLHPREVPPPRQPPPGPREMRHTLRTLDEPAPDADEPPRAA